MDYFRNLWIKVFILKRCFCRVKCEPSKTRSANKKRVKIEGERFKRVTEPLLDEPCMTHYNHELFLSVKCNCNEHCYLYKKFRWCFYFNFTRLSTHLWMNLGMHLCFRLYLNLTFLFRVLLHVLKKHCLCCFCSQSSYADSHMSYQRFWIQTRPVEKRFLVSEELRVWLFEE